MLRKSFYRSWGEQNHWVKVPPERERYARRVLRAMNPVRLRAFRPLPIRSETNRGFASEATERYQETAFRRNCFSAPPDRRRNFYSNWPVYCSLRNGENCPSTNSRGGFPSPKPHRRRVLQICHSRHGNAGTQRIRWRFRPNRVVMVAKFVHESGRSVEIMAQEEEQLTLELIDDYVGEIVSDVIAFEMGGKREDARKCYHALQRNLTYLLPRWAPNDLTEIELKRLDNPGGIYGPAERLAERLYESKTGKPVPVFLFSSDAFTIASRHSSVPPFDELLASVLPKTRSAHSR
jgi:hypothetical protein